MKTWFKMQAEDEKAMIEIYDEIGGWGVSARDFRDTLRELGDVSEIEMRINSPGGDVIQGFAIYNMIKEHPAKVTAKIDGWAASMASIIAMAADTIEMPSNTWMMIHNPWTVAMGDGDELRRMAEILDKMQNHALIAYENHSSLPESEIKALMDAETWMDGKEAVEKGFAEVLTDELEIAASVVGKKELNAPEAAMVWVKQEETKMEEKEVVDSIQAEDEKVEGVEKEEVIEDAVDTADEPEASEDSQDDDATEDGAEDENEAVEDGEVKDKFDAAYDEGEAAGYAKGKAEAEAELKNELDEIKEENEEAAVALEASDTAISDLNKEVEELKARLDKLTGGLKGEGKKEEITSFEQAVKADGYEKARKNHPKLYKAHREYNRNNRREK